MKRQHTLIAGLLIALAASGAAFAQPGGCGMGHGPGMGPGADMHALNPAQHLGELKTALKITSAQEAAWSKFENFVTQQETTRKAMQEQMRAQMQAAQVSGTRPDPAAMHASMDKVREAHQADHRAALQELYAALTPEQKTVADQHLRQGQGHGHGRHAPKDCPGA